MHTMRETECSLELYVMRPDADAATRSIRPSVSVRTAPTARRDAMLSVSSDWRSVKRKSRQTGINNRPLIIWYGFS